MSLEEPRGVEGGGGAVRARVLAYVRAVAGETEARSGVWVEHSYARGAGGGRVRELGAPPPPPPDDGPLDVVSPLPAPPRQPLHDPLDDLLADHLPLDTAESDTDDWEVKVLSCVAGASQRRLATAAAGAMRAARLALLAGGGKGAREAARSTAVRLRRALAAAGAIGGAAWLHCALVAHLPRPHRAIYDAALAELRELAPRAHARLVPAHLRHLPHSTPDPYLQLDCEVDVGGAGEPWLAWVRSGRSATDARWERCLSARLHVRPLPPVPPVDAPAAAPPPQHCAAAAAAAHHALQQLIAEAGQTPVVVGGFGAGAALCAALCGGAGGVARRGGPAAVRGVVLLAPPLLTAEGPRPQPDDPIHMMEVPVLVVSGTGGAAGGRGPCGAVAAGGPSGADRRCVLVRGADDALRLPARHRAALRLPQRALDATITEEVWRFVREVCARPEVHGHAGTGTQRHAHGHGYGLGHADPSEAGVACSGVVGGAEPEEYAHLPPADRLQAHGDGGAGRHGAGGATATTERRSSAAPAPAPSPADILDMPVVFLEDNRESGDRNAAATPISPAQAVAGVRFGGGGPYTRVLVAKRAVGGLLRRHQ